MIFLTGETTGDKMTALLKKYNWGRVFITKTPTPYEGEPWGFDNGAYRDYLAGVPFNEARFLHRLEIAYSVGEPLFAVVPDIIRSKDSLEFSLKWLDRLPKWPWYLAVQDGMEEADVEGVIHKFAGVFLGGSDKYKATARGWREFTWRHGKGFHYGRASTPRKIIHALDVKADSADSAFPLWTLARMELTAHVLAQTERQQALWKE